MDIELVMREGVSSPLEAEVARGTLASALEAAGAPADAQVTLILGDDQELADLNVEHMGYAGPTDVLSFPLLPTSAFPLHPGQGPAVRGAPEPFILPPGEPVHLGDIFVSVERAVAQAAEGRGGQTGDVRWSPADELRLLITHGGLHLCGWDHAEPEEEAAMRALELRLLGLDPAP